MLDPTEAAEIAERFGVALGQVRRDHLISHLLAALTPLADRLIFFGGTALSRTFVPDGRLSEDIDLLARGNRSDVTAEIEHLLVRGPRRDFPRLSWVVPLPVWGTGSGLVGEPDGPAVRLQVLPAHGYPPWPTETRDLEQRYADAPPARLSVPTCPAFVAWKTVAWGNRGTSRDLYDLWELAERGAIDAAAHDLYMRYGPSGTAPARHLFNRPPSEATWRGELSEQTRLTISAADALRAVRAAWERAGSSAPDPPPRASR